MQSIFLVPATRVNLEISLEKPVDGELAARHLDADLLRDIASQCGIEGIRCWAMTTTLRHAFEAMSPGDVVLFSEKGTGRFTHYAQVAAKTESATFGPELWPFSGQNPWTLVYFVTNVQRISCEKTELLQLFGYQKTDNLSGSRLVSSERRADFEVKVGDLSEWLGVHSDQEFLAKQIEVEERSEDDFTGENVDAPGKRRRGHSSWARKVLTQYGGVCGVCGLGDRGFVVAGHIVPWAADAAQRLNPRNGIAFCVLHDRAFERGLIGLDAALAFVHHRALDAKSVLGGLLAAVEGKKLVVADGPGPDLDLLARHRATHGL